MTRTTAPRILWTASAAAAVGLGVLAVSAVDAGAAPAPQPASATSTPGSGASASTPAPAPAPAPAPPASSAGEQVTVAGTVSATCDGGVLSFAGTPAPGWWLDDSPRPGEVEFETAGQKLEVKITCVDGTPRFFVEGPRADDNGRGRDDSSVIPAPSPPAPSAPTTGRGFDDSDGRVGGGHGRDDGPGDDRGRGSDDGPGDDSHGRVDRSGSDDHSDDDSGRGRGRGRGGDD